MRILLDESLPRKFAREPVGHQVQTVPQMGWAHKKNGELLRLASLVLLTAKSWDKVRATNEHQAVWDSYARACELILQSPISRNLITRNLHR